MARLPETMTEEMPFQQWMVAANTNTATQLFGCRLVFEGINAVPEAREKWSFDERDPLARIDKLFGLSQTEKSRVVRQDETLMLLSHLAEAIELKVYPYTQVLLGADLGSLIQIEGDDGNPLYVFRRTVDMLRARVMKFPQDERSQLTLKVFEQVIEPQMLLMKAHESLFFISPQNSEDDDEAQYGFAYVYRKRVNPSNGLEEIECLSVMVEWEAQEYEARLKMLESLRVDPFDVNAPIQLRVFKGGALLEDWDMQLQAGLFTGLERKLKEYEQLSLWAETQHNWHAYLMALENDLSWPMRVSLEGLQRAVIERFRPALYRMALWMEQTFGFALLRLGCGLMRWGNGINGDVMGISINWQPGVCRTCNRFDLVGDCSICQSCSIEFDLGIRH
jgi:hypothetical protein